MLIHPFLLPNADVRQVDAIESGGFNHGIVHHIVENNFISDF